MTRATNPPAPAGATILHGGGQRLPVRWINRDPPPMTISRYRVDPGEEITLHVHTGKAEYWVVLAGSGVVRIGGENLAVAEGDIVATAPGTPHALRNTGAAPLLFVNVVQPTGGPITTTELAGP